MLVNMLRQYVDIRYVPHNTHEREVMSSSYIIHLTIDFLPATVSYYVVSYCAHAILQRLLDRLRQFDMETLLFVVSSF